MLALPAVNWIAVVVAAIATVVIGAVWYAPPVFGKMWADALGWDERTTKENQKRVGPGYALAIVGALVTSYVVAITVKWAGAATAADAIGVAVLVWIGYVVTQAAIGTLFEVRSWRLFAINMGNQLVNLLAMGLILTLWA